VPATISNYEFVENNTITGPFAVGVLVTTPNILVQNNVITGPVNPGQNLSKGSGAGIQIQGPALMSAVITRNTVSNVPAPLRFMANNTGFAAKVSLNNFTAYTDEVLTPPTFNFEAELSVGQCSLDSATACSTDSECGSAGKGVCTNLQGNYWGLACPGFDPNKVLSVISGSVSGSGVASIIGTVNPHVHDSHAFGAPIPMGGDDDEDQAFPTSCF
jgi:hypothetical protein